MTAEQFGKAAVAAGVVSAEDLRTLWAALSAAERPKDGAALAKLLVQRGRLNQFQAQELLSGTGTPLVLGDYVLLAKIGSGGMGQVFKAEHRHMKRLVAIKLLPAALTKDEATIKRFQREVQAAAKLSHPNIVQAYDAGMQRGVWYLVMEYVEGRDLSAIVREHGPLPVREAVDCILQAARGLAYAHGEGVVHRDIKPANLLLDKRGMVKILDMGLARFDNAEAAADHQLTNTGTVMGTVDYMPPEQAANTHNADARSDIYALGCSLYRLLTGGNVYEGQTVVEKIIAHMNQPIPQLARHRPEVPAEIDRIFRKMVAKKPSDRYQQATQVVTELDAWLHPTAATTTFAAAQLAEEDSKLRAFLGSMSGTKTTHPGGASKTPLPLDEGGRRPDPRKTLLPPGEGARRADEGWLQTKAPSIGNSTSPHPAAAQPPSPQGRRLEAERATAAHVRAEIETDPDSASVVPLAASLATRSPGGRASRATRRKVLIGAGFFGALLILAGVIVIIKNDRGEEIGRLELPPGQTAEVQNRTSEPRTSVSGTNTTEARTSVSGANTTEARTSVSGATSLPLPNGRGSEKSPPPPAIAPFDAKQARAHQDAWAKHLNTKIETTNSIGMRMVLIPPGEFLMGSTPEQNAVGRKMCEDDNLKPEDSNWERLRDEMPQHKVAISRPFLMASTEVTIGQFKKFIEATNYLTEAEQYGFGNSSGKTVDVKSKTAFKEINWKNPGFPSTDDTVVTQITWNDACAFCAWLSEQEERRPWYRADGNGAWQIASQADGYRLPTEAEWEYACRAGTTTQFWFGDDVLLLPQYDVFTKNSGGKPRPVALKLANPFGLFDMHGNVREWCQDWHDAKWYEKSPPSDPLGPSSGTRRMLRGGHWYNTPSGSRSALRIPFPPSSRYSHQGFRVVRVW